MKKLLNHGILNALLFLLPWGLHAQVKIVEWNFNSVYNQSTIGDTTVYTPSSTTLIADPNVTISNSKFKILPDSAVDSIQHYNFNAVTSYCQLKSGYNNYVARLMFQGPSSVTDYSQSVNHKNYFQFTLPTTGYDSIQVNFSFSSGQNSTADYVELVYSVDDGATWADCGSFHALSGWWLYQAFKVPIAARDKKNVIIRLISNTDSTNGTANFNLDYFTVNGKIYSAGIPVNSSASITWPFGLGTTGQLATFSTGTDGYFSTNWVDKGSNINYKDKATSNAITFTRFYPTVQDNSVTVNDFVAFCVRPKTGLSFTPSSIAFDCQRYGTDGGLIDVIWKSADGTLTTIATGLKPARDNSGGVTHASYDLSTLPIPASNGDCGLYVYIYSLGNTKAIGLANLVINGNVKGTIVNVVTHTFASSVYPAQAGSISANPVGTEFDEGTDITLTANRNFGFQFKEWRDANADTLISTSNPLKITLHSNMAIKAVFDSINTYSLNINTQGGAPIYMVTFSPAGTIVNGKTMYEQGTMVTLSANNNNILTFNNWLTGETSANLSVQMNQNQNITAVYSTADYIAGWDFYNPGGSSRPADFYSSSDNQTATLVLRKADGTVNSWLDKSIKAANGYYNRGAAVNWKPVADQYYYQISFNAKNYTDIHVTAGLLYNYNAYTIQKCEYSINDTTYTTLGTDTLTAGQTWFDKSFSLPSTANHADKVYIRWIPDYASPMAGATAANNDGTSISNIYLTAKSVIYNDSTPPVLSSSVPISGAIGASATGKVVLTFNKKIMLTSNTVVATLGSKQLTPVVSGNAVTFSYSGLDYNTQFSFTLPANSISDLAGNILNAPINFSFTTMLRPTVVKKSFDYVVGVDGDFKAAIQAATAASSSGNRFKIFFPNGQYNIGVNTGNSNQMTSFSLPNVSFIGQSADSVVLYNKPTTEGISSTATIQFTNTANNIYMQDITLLNNMDYRSGTLLGRAVALWDQGTKNIYKNVNLLSDQDTYYSGNGRIYFEGGSIHGTVDFICGGGDVFFNECLLYVEERTGCVLTAPATTSAWGYVFSNCTVDGFPIANGNYYLGRPWQNAPRSIYINTKMNILPTAAGWTEMGVVPALFAEFNSTTSSGIPVDLSSRKKSFTYNGVTTAVNPYLTADQAAQYTVSNVLGGTDAWQPQEYTDQAGAPVISGNNNSISWADNNYVSCWAVFKNNVLVQFVTTNSYNIPSTVNSGIYTVRAANEMGGLSAPSNAFSISITGITNPDSQSKLINQTFFTIDGKKLNSINGFKGAVIVRSIYDNGKVITSKQLKTSH